MSMSATTAAIIAGGAQSVGTGITSIFNTHKTIKAQKHLAEYAYQKDLEMWNAANAYNSPEAQMSRLTKAGLNPNLVYGNGSVVGNTTTQTPKYQMYSPEYKYEAPQVSNVIQMLSQYQDYQNKKSINEGIMLDNIDKANRNLHSSDMWKFKTEGLDWSAYRTKQEGIIRQKYAENAPAMFGIDVNKRLNELSLQSAQIKSIQANTEARELENKLLKLGIRGSDNILLRMLIQGANLTPEKIKNIFPKFSTKY